MAPPAWLSTQRRKETKQTPSGQRSWRTFPPATEGCRPLQRPLVSLFPSASRINSAGGGPSEKSWLWGKDKACSALTWRGLGSLLGEAQLTSLIPRASGPSCSSRETWKPAKCHSCGHSHTTNSLSRHHSQLPAVQACKTENEVGIRHRR